jgi:lactate permease
MTSKILNVNAWWLRRRYRHRRRAGASVISPAKLQNAAATIDALGIESEVIKTAIIISIVITFFAGVIAMIFAQII